jgi:hypothetical protein
MELPKIVRSILDCFEKKHGEIELSPGEYELFISVRIRPGESVNYEIHKEDHSTCSHLSDDIFEIKEKKFGFDLKCLIESEKVKFIWRVG